MLFMTQNQLFGTRSLSIRLFEDISKILCLLKLTADTRCREGDR